MPQSCAKREASAFQRFTFSARERGGLVEVRYCTKGAATDARRDAPGMVLAAPAVLRAFVYALRRLFVGAYSSGGAVGRGTWVELRARAVGDCSVGGAGI